MTRRHVLTGAAALLSGCRQASPGKDTGAVPSSRREILRRAREFDLVDALEEDPRLLANLRYASRHNLTGRRLYPADMPCLVHTGTMHRLGFIAARLATRGMRLLIWDAYRPPEAQTLLWKRVGNEEFVHKPGEGGRWSWHCYGRALDATLADAAGRPLPMPSDLDDFTAAGSLPYSGNDPAIEQRLEFLRITMLTYGMQPIAEEWWHFHDPMSPAPAQPVWARDLGLQMPA